MLAFTFSFFAFVLGAAVISASALPATDTSSTNSRRADLGPWCNGIGIGAIGDQANFKLTAFNTTGVNANATGAPLVLAPSPHPYEVNVWALSTYATYPHDDYPTMSIVNGRLFPKGPYPGVGAGVTAGEEVEIVAGPFTRGAYFPQQYCVMAQTSSHAQSHENLLAVNGGVAGFSLCAVGSEYHVVYKPTSGKNYDLQSCYGVFLQVIPAQ